MAEMAAELGLSRLTVSAVVNGRARRIGFAVDTIRRVERHLAARGYMPSHYACGLRSAPTRVVGVIHIDRISTHVVEAFHRLAEELGAVVPGLETMVTARERLEASVRELRFRRVTDLVWVHNNSVCEDYREPNIVNYLSHMRTVIYNFPFDSPLGDTDLVDQGVGLVGVDRTKQARQLARFLRRLGHKVVALPDVDMLSPSDQTYCDVFASAGIAVAACTPPFRAAEFIDAMSCQRITAAWFHGDSLACQAIGELRAMGVRIPEDLTVIGFDGMSRPYRQDLTTLVMPVQAMVAKVRDIVSGKETALRHCFDLELVKGVTHGPPRGR